MIREATINPLSYILALLVITMLIVATPTPAQSAGASCSAKSRYHVGATNPFHTTTYGVRADIETLKPALCSPGNSPSFSTV